jgi:preprotein translocase subunit SecA
MLKKIMGDPNARVLKSRRPVIEKINALEPQFEAMESSVLSGLADQYKERHQEGESLDDLLPEVFAATREVAKRTLGQRHYDVQLLGGIVLHKGEIAEMRTGEGKTLTSTLAVALNALAGEGAHVVTVNDYLSMRDAAWMGQIFHALGLTVGVISHAQAYRYDPSVRMLEADEERDITGSFKVAHDFLRPTSRREAYEADITYGTNNEFGFDYLRDNMVTRLEQMVQRSHHYAIIDEIDSILIDEARTPLIISAPAEESTDEYQRFAKLVRALVPETHYGVDEKLRAVSLTEEGITELEERLGIENIYSKGTRLVHHIEQALRAHVLFLNDRDYVVRDGEVLIVDEFTGRLMQGRRYSEGLHQAIEAKEGVQIQRESQTLATITFQNYFRLYEKLAGMTGTAATEAEEFSKIYGLDVVSVPTNRPPARKDLGDQIYRNERAKLAAVVAEVKARHETGQPVLIGTISIEKNEQLHDLLKQSNVPHAVLNAKQHEQEGETIAQAGRKGAVTLATNMAGRGVDVILGGSPANTALQDDVCALGGLHVIGTERHESRRIDNQLRGRSGRQGDPGSSQFFVALDDDLMRIFGGERLQSLMERLKVPEDVPIENRLISKQIEGAQRKVEHHHFDSRKHLLEYDDVIAQHREVVYRKRQKALRAASLNNEVREVISSEAERIVGTYTLDDVQSNWNLDEFADAVARSYPIASEHLQRLRIPPEQGNDGKRDAAAARTVIVDALVVAIVEQLDTLKQTIGSEEGLRDLHRAVMLRVIDQLWIEHLEAIGHLRHGIGLRGYGQRDPLVEYKRESYRLFTELLALIEHDIVRTLLHVGPAAVATESVFSSRDLTLAGAKKTMAAGGGGLAAAVSPGGTPSVAPKPKRLSDAVSVAPSEKVRDTDGRKVGRNDPCPCGSGKKYKKCHGGQA